VAPFPHHSLAEFCAGLFAVRGKLREVFQLASFSKRVFWGTGGKRADVFTARA
jgi:hypothetical protein